MDIGRRLKNLRKRQKVSMSEIANFIGVSQQAYSRYERNERQISLQKLELVAKFYRISLQALLFDTDKLDNIDSLEFDERVIYFRLLYLDLIKFDKKTGKLKHEGIKNEFYVDDNYYKLLHQYQKLIKWLKEDIEQLYRVIGQKDTLDI
jgi:transcriptional regulator with XRE-family HTH domain